MKIKTTASICLLLLLLFLLASDALAMSSASYKLEWFTPLTSGGGGAMSSASYAVNVTIGQSAIGSSASANYGVGLGYWYGLLESRIYLPLILR